MREGRWTFLKKAMEKKRIKEEIEKTKETIEELKKIKANAEYGIECNEFVLNAFKKEL